MPKIKLMFAWYDFWVGAYWDRYARRLYIFPVPMFGIVIQFRARTRCRDEFIESIKEEAAQRLREDLSTCGYVRPGEWQCNCGVPGARPAICQVLIRARNVAEFRQRNKLPR
jgi:hypothetical protein